MLLMSPCQRVTYGSFESYRKPLLMTFNPFFCLLWRFGLVFWSRASINEIGDEESPLLSYDEHSTNEQTFNVFIHHANGSKLRYRARMDPQLDVNMIHPDAVRELGLSTMCACGRSCRSVAESECSKQATTRLHFDGEGVNATIYAEDFAIAPWQYPFDVVMGKRYVRQTNAANVIVLVGSRSGTVHMPKESKGERVCRCLWFHR